MISHQFGRQIRARRSKVGMGQAALASRARVSRTVISRLENLQSNAVQTNLLDRLCASLGAQATVSLEANPGAARTEARLRQNLREAELRARHLRIALELCLDPRSAPGKVERARRQVDLWVANRSCSPTYVLRWRAILRRAPREVARAMNSLGEWENALFQNSPWTFLWT